MTWGLLASEQTLAKTPQKRLLTAFNKLGGTSYHPAQNNPLKQILWVLKNLLRNLLKQKLKQNVSKHTSKNFYI